MRIHVESFGQWTRINESDLTNLSVEEIRLRIDQLKEMAKLGLIEPAEIRNMIRQLDSKKIQILLPELNIVKDLPEYQELLDKGLVLVSSKTQLLNGNIILSYPGYDRLTKYALGFFGDLQVFRRMMPKSPTTGYWGGSYVAQDVIIKRFSDIPAEDFYRVAMRYALDKIDFTKEDPKRNTPYFPVKRRSI